MSKISDLPAAVPTGGERVVMVQNNKTVGAPLGSIVNALAQPLVEAAEDSAHRAELAALAVQLSAPLFDTLAEGEAATANGDIFSVRGGGEEFATLHRRTVSGSEELGSYPSSLAVAHRVRLSDLQSNAADKGAALVGFDFNAEYPDGSLGAAIKLYRGTFDYGIWTPDGEVVDLGEWASLKAPWTLGFPARSIFVAVVAIVFAETVDGQTVSAEGLSYVRKSGATAIPDLPGWVPAGPVHAGHFGFVGIGTRADTLKLTTSAFAYLHSLGGGTLHFTAGLFLIGNTNSDTTRSGGNWDNQAGLWVKHDNIRLKGAGENVTILQLADGQDAHVLKFGQRVGASIAVKGCGFSDLTIDGNRDNQTPANQATYFNNSGVDISTGCTDFLGERATIKECQWYGIGVQRDDFHNIILRQITFYRTGSDAVDAKGDSSRNTRNVLESPRAREWGLAEPGTQSAAYDMRSGWLVIDPFLEIDADDPITYPRDGIRIQDSASDPDPTPKQATAIVNGKAYGGRSQTTTISGSAGVRAKTRWARIQGGEYVGWNHGFDLANPDCFVTDAIVRSCYKGAYLWQDSYSDVGAEADQSRLRFVARNNVFGVHLDSVDNATIDCVIVGNGTNLWIGEGCTKIRVRGEIFGGTTANLVNEGTGTSLLNVAGISTSSKRVVAIPVDSIGLKTGSVEHHLGVEPKADDVLVSPLRGTDVSDYAYAFFRVASVDATHIDYEVMISTASATADANMNLLLVTRALEF
ncbi:uncharacterized protein YbjQ (UPF0145 family) [Sphingobium sp. JAI105]|uniref:hypothetical protein n=1 Tax=Sphingobium sp. JAI105 TaxID=2787715 RepID=UPI0018C92CC2|nr:hypothetical protein [Sphingobium sp. JAI105]MBG6116203.1 uncharacterized protein YbjQ (UPF0145 family) [Sphingobium sp. JAI105]